MPTKWIYRHIYVDLTTGEVSRTTPKDKKIIIIKNSKRKYYDTNQLGIVELTHYYRIEEYTQTTIQF